MQKTRPFSIPSFRLRRMLFSLLSLLLLSPNHALLQPTSSEPNLFCGRFYLSVPVAVQDWQGLASLLVESFPENQSAPWWQQPVLRTSIYRHYVQTARRMRGKKYALHLAKDAVTDRVLGVAEVGRSALAEDVVTTIGVLAVHPEARRHGMARRLVHECLQTAANWESSHLYVEVEPINEIMMQCLDKLDFDRIYDELIDVPVMRRGTEKELRPHYVYRRPVAVPEESGNDDSIV